MLSPMDHWPAKDAYMTEHLRPLSALLNSTRVSFFSDDEGAARLGNHGAMVQRLNKKWCRHAKHINMSEFRRLHAGGMTTAKMATALNVSQRAVRRAIKTVRGDG